MDKKSVQAVAVTIFSGVLFLESMFAGGVASEETGKVLDGMRGLRRVNNVHYLVTNSYSGSQDIVQQTQEVWADLDDITVRTEKKVYRPVGVKVDILTDRDTIVFSGRRGIR